MCASSLSIPVKIVFHEKLPTKKLQILCFIFAKLSIIFSRQSQHTISNCLYKKHNFYFRSENVFFCKMIQLLIYTFEK